ncbi:MAG: hypothetical protein JWN40_5719 [Phycisphaerales bacterium]|nr:hypothetical protein [Phycisphaerales bacterium]
MIDTVLQSVRAQVLHRVWVFSDLQQSIPAEARRCLSTAVDDFRSLGLPVEQIWYLGDAVEGARLDHLEEMAAMQVEVLTSFGVPLRYVLGNHDFDLLTQDKGRSGRAAIFRDAVLRTPGWRTTDSIESFYFSVRIGEFTVAFFSDHADPMGRWISTHGTVHGEASAYPHDAAAYRQVRDELAGAAGPVITCSHYAFAGGNRPSSLHDLMLPLPANIRLHLYGHAHIGDAVWAGKDLYRKIATVDHHPLIQCDVASLEDGRGSATRSMVLEIYRDRSLGLFFRNHSTRRWEESLMLDAQR